MAVRFLPRPPEGPKSRIIPGVEPVYTLSHISHINPAELAVRAEVRDETPDYRSWVMSHVHGKDTVPELRVRSLMHQAGYRYRLHVSGMPGKPDVVLPRYRTAVFVNGCFWHRHPGCKHASTPKTNVGYWAQKFERNVSRDEETHAALRREGWTVVVIWECQTRNAMQLASLLSAVLPPRH